MQKHMIKQLDLRIRNDTEDDDIEDWEEAFLGHRESESENK